MGSARVLFALAVTTSLAHAACDTGPARDTRGATPDPAPPVAPATVAAPAEAKAAPAAGVLRIGAPIETSAPSAALAEIAKRPDAYVGKTFATTGTVTAVCQHMGCWMEIADDASQAHVKMAGHAFYVPRTASGRRARVLATLVKAGSQEGACDGEGHAAATSSGGGDAPSAHGKGKGCRAEAEAQLGRSLAKLELVAQGVELL